jgi:hypothetical protein
MKYLMFFLFLCPVVLASCKQKKSPQAAAQDEQAALLAESNQKIDSLTALLHEGDMVARSGTTWDSKQIKDFQTKVKTFTHVGIAKKVNGEWVVYHLTGRDSTYLDDHMMYEPVAKFLRPELCDTIGLFRFTTDSAETRAVIAFAEKCYQDKIKFDYFFDMKNDTAMTCSEMVSKAVARATNNRITFGFTPITEIRHVRLIKQYYRRYKPQDSDIIGRPIIGVDDVTVHKDCKKIAQFAYPLPAKEE